MFRKKWFLFLVLPSIVTFGVAVIIMVTQSGNDGMSEAEYEALYGYSRDGTPSGSEESYGDVEIGDCVNAAPNSDQSADAEAIDCGSMYALAEVVSFETATCGPGYISATGRNIAVARVEYEEVCIEELANSTEREIETLDAENSNNSYSGGEVEKAESGMEAGEATEETLDECYAKAKTEAEKYPCVEKYE